MPSRPSIRNSIANVVAGLLGAYGVVSFFCFICLDQTWIAEAPRQPNELLGLVYQHGEHGARMYFSAFQATACAIMFFSIPLAFLATALRPKRSLRIYRPGVGLVFKWDYDDPLKLMGKAFAIGAVATPLIMLTLGPPLVRGLNAAGVVLNLG